MHILNMEEALKGVAESISKGNQGIMFQWLGCESEEGQARPQMSMAVNVDRLTTNEI